jgi:hypothetical protein
MDDRNGDPEIWTLVNNRPRGVINEINNGMNKRCRLLGICGLYFWGASRLWSCEVW